jgi:hypothetical protein
MFRLRAPSSVFFTEKTDQPCANSAKTNAPAKPPYYRKFSMNSGWKAPNNKPAVQKPVALKLRTIVCPGANAGRGKCAAEILPLQS